MATTQDPFPIQASVLKISKRGREFILLTITASSISVFNMLDFLEEGMEKLNFSLVNIQWNFTIFEKFNKLSKLITYGNEEPACIYFYFIDQPK